MRDKITYIKDYPPWIHKNYWVECRPHEVFTKSGLTIISYFNINSCHKRLQTPEQILMIRNVGIANGFGRYLQNYFNYCDISKLHETFLGSKLVQLGLSQGISFVTFSISSSAAILCRVKVREIANYRK